MRLVGINTQDSQHVVFGAEGHTQHADQTLLFCQLGIVIQA